MRNLERGPLTGSAPENYAWVRSGWRWPSTSSW